MTPDLVPLSLMTQIRMRIALKTPTQYKAAERKSVLNCKGIVDTASLPKVSDESIKQHNKFAPINEVDVEEDFPISPRKEKISRRPTSLN